MPYLRARGRCRRNPAADQLRPGAAAAPLVQERSALLSEAAAMVRFLFTAEDDFAVDPAAAGKVSTPASRPVLEAAIAAVGGAGRVRRGGNGGGAEGRAGRGPRAQAQVAFGPVRVAVTGRTISPPLYESMELLGRDVTVRRLRSALGSLAGVTRSSAARRFGPLDADFWVGLRGR